LKVSFCVVFSREVGIPGDLFPYWFVGVR
jgi:hypothetical protein